MVMNSTIQGQAVDLVLAEELSRIQKSREAFEKLLNIHARRRNEHGDYVLPSIQDRWAGWDECWRYIIGESRIF